MIMNLTTDNNYAENWLINNAPFYVDLSEEEKNTIKTFSLLWSLCESLVLNRFASVNLIINKVNRFTAINENSIISFLPILSFFQSRYLTNGVVNQRFFSLNFRPRDQKSLVADVLVGNSSEPTSIISALFVIVYRVRNNFFHGEKWVDGFRGQQSLFLHSNLFLTKILEIYQR